MTGDLSDSSSLNNFNIVTYNIIFIIIHNNLKNQNF